MLEIIKNLVLPEWIKNNIVTALGKGINGIITEAVDIPKTALNNYNERIKLIGEINREFVKKAAQHPLNEIECEPELAKRVLKGYGIKLIEEQLNKDNVAQKTIEHLKTFKNTENLTEKNIDYDWLTSFWNLVGTKSEDEIQEILSKILANEITQPGSISMHTLQTLSILDSKVGNIFAHFCNLSIDDGATAHVIHPNVFAFQNVGPLEEFGISLNDLFYLDGANLIRSAECIRLQFKEAANPDSNGFEFESVDYAGKKAKIDVNGNQLCVLFFTQTGRELRGLINLNPIDSYTEALKNLLKEKFVLLE